MLNKSHTFFDAALAFFLGIGAYIVYIFSMPSDLSPIYGSIKISALIYFVFGVIAGLLSASGPLWKGLWVAAPLNFVAILSFLFAGIYTPKIFSQDLPMLVTTMLSACLGALLGSFLRRFFVRPKHAG